MELELYLQHYKAFDDEFFPNETLEEIEDKCLEEMDELNEALTYKSPLADRISEALDQMNMTLKLLKAYGVHDPLYSGARKLQANAALYRSGNKRIK